MKITIEFEDEGRNNKIIPLFEKVIYSRSAYPEEQLKPLPCPVVAFHSYKGGVGRTLSLLAFSSIFPCSQDKPGAYNVTGFTGY